MQNVTALVVDDEAHIRLFVKTLLTGMGCRSVVEAGNGHEALAQFDAHRPDLVLLDINMPVVDGIQTLKALREKSPDTAVIMLSSLASADVLDTCLDAGANYMLRKDLPLDELRAEITATWNDHVHAMENRA